VILLTAQSSDDHQIEGLEAGAIEFVTKPFNFKILLSTIKNTLDFQEKVIEANKRMTIVTTEVSIVSQDEQFISKATKVVEENISNPKFSVEDLSHELGYSRAKFYQKMLKIMAMTPMDFMRHIRMSRAEDLLRKSQLTISEIAYMVGYNNPKLFSRYFKYHFKKYPSEFRLEIKNTSQADDIPEEN
jgi:AraC-like DNA-binding protein